MSKSLNLRLARNRRPDANPDPAERVETLTRTARVTWLGLLSYLAFVVVTLMGVEDADFFLPERQTDLPVVGVSVQTNLFFYIAPLLGALLYIHMHFYLLKLWKALGELPCAVKRPADECITPWLVSDMALRQREHKTHDYPLGNLARWGAILSIFVAAPAVLAALWWRSMPKHDEILTLLACGLPLFVSVFAGWESWRALHCRGAEARPIVWHARLAWAAGFICLSALGHLRIEGDVTDAFLRQAQLSGVAFVDTPPEWLPLEKAEQAFRPTWCANHGVSRLACGPGPLAKDEEGNRIVAPPYLTRQRTLWCEAVMGTKTTENECTAQFERMDAAYKAAWYQARLDALMGLPKRDLSDADLRHADLQEAQMRGANLGETRLERTNLAYVQMEGANLWKARMDEALLLRTRIEGAILRDVSLDGALLVETRMDRRTILTGAELVAAAHWKVDFSEVDISAEQINASFGDASVILPEGMARPEHWPDWELSFDGDHAFLTEWRKWRADPAGYTPPSKPEG